MPDSIICMTLIRFCRVKTSIFWLIIRDVTEGIIIKILLKSVNHLMVYRF